MVNLPIHEHTLQFHFLGRVSYELMEAGWPQCLVQPTPEEM